MFQQFNSNLFCFKSMATCIPRQLSMSFRATGARFGQNLSRSKSTNALLKTPSQADGLTWPHYLSIKRSKRLWQTALTVPCALVGLGGGLFYFGSLETDPTKPIMGIDPFFFYGICTVGCIGAGALVGPTIGSAIWRLVYRNKIPLIDSKDREFYNRISKNRVDATLQSPTHPVPDYYGEKIGSLHGYRSWLRDQAKYRRKVLFAEK